MNDFIFSLNSTMPVFAVIVLGYILMRCGLFTKEFARVADKYVFKVALPVLLFKEIATADIRAVFDLKFVLFCMGSTTVMFMGIWVLSTILIKDKSILGAFVQASARGSAAVLGIAFIQNIYGGSGMGPLMIVSAVPLYNIYSVIILTFCSNEQTDGSGHIKKAFINVIKNPIILGIFAGIPFSVTGFDIPVIPMKTVVMIAQTATPIALLTVGATFEGRKAVKKLKPTVIAAFIKLVGIPAVFFPFAVKLGFRNSDMVAILVMLGSPTTVTCYIMAKNMGNDAELSASVVVVATLFSSVTLTMWIYILRTMGLI